MPSSPSLPAHGPRSTRSWSRPNWRGATLAWAEIELERVGQGPIRRVAEVRSWDLSCVLRIESETASWYLKAVPPALAHEPAVIRRLARIRPENVPAIAAHDPLHRCWLMAECPGARLAECADLTDWTATLEVYARLQIAALDHLGELSAAGYPRRSLTDLAAYVDVLLADDEALRVGEPDGLSARRVGILRTRAPELRQACERLAGSAVPATLEHGDLWEENVIAGAAPPVFLDWTETSLTHPFLSLLPLFAGEALERWLGPLAEVRDRLRDAYLGPWRSVLPGVPLEATFELAQAVAAVHHAAIYHRQILPLVETEPSLRRYLPMFLGTLFDSRYSRHRLVPDLDPTIDQ